MLPKEAYHDLKLILNQNYRPVKIYLVKSLLLQPLGKIAQLGNNPESRVVSAPQKLLIYNNYLQDESIFLR